MILFVCRQKTKAHVQTGNNRIEDRRENCYNGGKSYGSGSSEPKQMSAAQRAIACEVSDCGVPKQMSVYWSRERKKIVKPTAIYYNTKDPAKANLVKAILMQLDVRIREVSPEQTNETVGYLAGIEGFAPLGAFGRSAFGARKMTGLEKFLPIIMDEVLIMHDFTQEKLDELLAELRRVQAQVALKAVITPSNCSWTFLQLYEELKEEHAQMTQRMQKKPEK